MADRVASKPADDAANRGEASNGMATWTSDIAPRQHRWGMAVDLDLCTGCSACVVACHAENNLAIAGPIDTDEGRSFDWIRIERYWEGEYPDVKAHFLPVMCQHCAAAPCEPVCPVFATYHTPEGLNAQIYNRCIGTRFCQNNDPYNVRFFTWFEPALNFPDPLPHGLNPDVTVRSRGVMEKCTFCVHRIRQAEDDARVHDRKLSDGEFTTACAQACSARALVFGDLTDPNSALSQKIESSRRFRLLESLGTEPVVYYLKGGAHT